MIRGILLVLAIFVAGGTLDLAWPCPVGSPRCTWQCVLPTELAEACAAQLAPPSCLTPPPPCPCEGETFVRPPRCRPEKGNAAWERCQYVVKRPARTR